MRRYHLFEFNDSVWFPELLRHYETDYLEALFRKLGIYGQTVPLLSGLLERHRTETLADLCSGGGGPLPALVPALRKVSPQAKVLLTDKFPNLVAFEDMAERHVGIVEYRGEPVDVLDPPKDLPGVATMFDALHHFQPSEAKQILVAMQRDGRPVAIFDATNRSWGFILGAIFIPLTVLLLTPAIRPFRFRRLLFTYLIPILPMVIAWDGFVSHLRAHKPDEVRQWMADQDQTSYSWRVEELTSGPAKILAIVGEPVGSAGGG